MPDVQDAPCVICGEKLPSALGTVDSLQPYGGTNFETYGHYGSTAFDPIDGTKLSVNICDPCLLQMTEKGRVFLISPVRGSSVVPWDGR